MTTNSRFSPQISRVTVKSLAELDLAICSFRKVGRPGTLSGSHAMWPKAAVPWRVICSANAGRGRISELVMCVDASEPQGFAGDIASRGPQCLHISDMESPGLGSIEKY